MSSWLARGNGRETKDSVHARGLEAEDGERRKRINGGGRERRRSRDRSEEESRDSDGTNS